MKVVVVLNAKAGTLARGTAEDGVARVRAAFERLGVRPNILRTDAEGCAEALRQAIAAAPDLLAIGGGDGTLNAAAARLAGSGLPMAVLPLGTFNHFAKDLDIPLDFEEAVVLACQGEARPVDIAEVNGRVFINHSAIGIYPYMLREREERRARFGHGKWRAMVVATAKALHDYPLLGFRVRVGDEALVRRSPFLFIGNNRYINRSYGLVEDSRRNSLTLVIAHDTGRLGLARIALRSLLGRVHGETALDRFELTSAVVESRRRHLLVGIDGELVEIAPPLRYCLLPAALRVVQPRRRPKARVAGELPADATVGDDIDVTRGEGRPWTGNGSPEIGRNSRDASASAGAS